MSLGRFLRDLVIVLAATGAVVFALIRWAAIPWAVEGRSMEPTLSDGDRVIVDLWTLRRRAPRAGEVILLQGPGEESLVKRVAREPLPGGTAYPPATLSPDSPLEPSYIVLGDNPQESSDSRMFGRVPAHLVRGRVVWRYWPLSRWGRIE